jgi:hypothetical protein
VADIAIRRIYAHLKKPAVAAYYCKKAHKMFHRMRKRDEALIASVFLARSYAAQGRTRQARKRLRKAGDQARRLGRYKLAKMLKEESRSVTAYKKTRMRELAVWGRVD